jgi:hypothetical protein
MRRATGECAWFLKPIHTRTELQLPLRFFLNERQIPMRTGSTRWERSTVWGLSLSPRQYDEEKMLDLSHPVAQLMFLM